MPSQEEYRKMLQSQREQDRKDSNEEYRKKYMTDVEVGSYVAVKCDGPGPCRGVLEFVGEDGITVYTCDSVRPEHVFIEYHYLRDYVVQASRYADRVVNAMHKLINKCKAGDIVDVYCDTERYTAVFVRFTFDSVIVATSNGDRAIPVVSVNEISVRDNASAIKWCRDNAPDAAKDLSNSALWKLMQSEYISHGFLSLEEVTK